MSKFQGGASTPPCAIIHLAVAPLAVSIKIWLPEHDTAKFGR